MKQLFLFFLIFSGSYCNPPSPNKPPEIEVGGKAYVKIEAVNVSDATLIYCSYWPLLVCGYELFSEEQTIVSDTVVWLSLDISVPSKQNIHISKNTTVSVFLAPSDTLVMKVDYNQHSGNSFVVFKGSYANICQYLYDMPESLAFSVEGANLYNDPYRGKSPEEALIHYRQFSDSFATKQKEYLQRNKEKYRLPPWFIEFETQERDLYAIHSQLMLPNYWKFFFDVEVETPEGYFDRIKKIDVNLPTSVFSFTFYMYMGSLLHKELDFEGKEEQLKNNQGFESIDQLKGTNAYTDFKVKFFRDAVDKAETLLDEEHYDPFLLNYFFIFTNREGNDIKSKCLTYVETKLKDEPYRPFLLKNHEIHSGLLVIGTQAPGFYLLSDQENRYLNLSDYKGKVILLNFWFPGCKPCIAEIPHEKALIDKYGTSRFAIINICLESTPEQWKRAIKRYELSGVNMVAQGNWERKLKEEYGVGGFPHYVLIDQEGKIIENNTYKPREAALADLIEKHLSR